MCKSCQYCLETCYWHLIEKRYCYDESIALYEPHEKEEKNNNTFENMAFYDSVAVIAGRAIVTIDPLPERPVVQQPRKRPELRPSTPKTQQAAERSRDEPPDQIPTKAPPQFTAPGPLLKPLAPVVELLSPPVAAALLQPPTAPPEVRKKSLRERRMSKSLHLKIEQPKELPIIRQNSMPKFYLDTPEDNQAISVMLQSPSTTLTSPVPNNSSGFIYDLYSVVHMERERLKNVNQAPIHSKDDRPSSRLFQIKEKIKLRRVKSSLGVITNLPHSHHI